MSQPAMMRKLLEFYNVIRHLCAMHDTYYIGGDSYAAVAADRLGKALSIVDPHWHDHLPSCAWAKEREEKWNIPAPHVHQVHTDEFSQHELLDRTYLLMEILGEHLASHPALDKLPYAKASIEMASGMLASAYQEIGKETL